MKKEERRVLEFYLPHGIRPHFPGLTIHNTETRTKLSNTRTFSNEEQAKGLPVEGCRPSCDSSTAVASLALRGNGRSEGTVTDRL